MLSIVRTEAEVWLKRAANSRRLGEFLQLQDADAAGTDRFQRLVVPVRPGDGRILFYLTVPVVVSQKWILGRGDWALQIATDGRRACLCI